MGYADLNSTFTALTGEEADGPIVDLHVQVDGQSGGYLVDALVEDEEVDHYEITGTFKDGRRIA